MATISKSLSFNHMRKETLKHYTRHEGIFHESSQTCSMGYEYSIISTYADPVLYMICTKTTNLLMY